MSQTTTRELRKSRARQRVEKTTFAKRAKSMAIDFSTHNKLAQELEVLGNESYSYRPCILTQKRCEDAIHIAQFMNLIEAQCHGDLHGVLCDQNTMSATL